MFFEQPRAAGGRGSGHRTRGALLRYRSDCTTGYCDQATRACVAFKPVGVACAESAECATANCRTTCQALVGTGGACTSNIDCEQISNNCGSTHTCAKGFPVGGPCANTSDCQAFAYCKVAMGQCAADPSTGETCDPDAMPCGDGSFCDATSQVCTAPRADGGGCTSDPQCASHACDAATATCVTPAVCI